MSDGKTILVDVSRCTGCRGCQVACKLENGVALGEGRNKVCTIGPSGVYPELEMYFLTAMCQQCENPACAAVCQFRGVEFYQFLYTEDNLGGDFWDPGLLGKLPQDAKEAYFRLTLELARRYDYIWGGVGIHPEDALDLPVADRYTQSS